MRVRLSRRAPADWRPREITAAWLREMGACEDGVQTFSTIFPKGRAPFTEDTFWQCVKAGINWSWVISHAADETTRVRFNMASAVYEVRRRKAIDLADASHTDSVHKWVLRNVFDHEDPMMEDHSIEIEYNIEQATARIEADMHREAQLIATRQQAAEAARRTMGGLSRYIRPLMRGAAMAGTNPPPCPYTHRADGPRCGRTDTHQHGPFAYTVADHRGGYDLAAPAPAILHPDTLAELMRDRR